MVSTESADPIEKSLRIQVRVRHDPPFLCDDGTLKIRIITDYNCSHDRWKTLSEEIWHVARGVPNTFFVLDVTQLQSAIG